MFSQWEFQNVKLTLFFNYWPDCNHFRFRMHITDQSGHQFALWTMGRSDRFYIGLTRNGHSSISTSFEGKSWRRLTSNEPCLPVMLKTSTHPSSGCRDNCSKMYYVPSKALHSNHLSPVSKSQEPFILVREDTLLLVYLIMVIHLEYHNNKSRTFSHIWDFTDLLKGALGKEG